MQTLWARVKALREHHSTGKTATVVGMLSVAIAVACAKYQKKTGLAQTRVARAASSATSLTNGETKTPRQEVVVAVNSPLANNGRPPRGITRAFILQLTRLLRIVLSSIKSKEAAVLLGHTAFLVLRTFLSIYIATLDGLIVRAIVERKGKEFAWNILKWFVIAVPASYTNSMIQYLERKLSIAFRTRLVEYLYGLYMSNETYYRVGNLDSRLPNADQCLTEDVSRFCSALAHLYSQISKPLLDVVLMTFQLIYLGSIRHGALGPALAACVAGIVVYITARVLKFITPPFGKLVEEQAKLEGELRSSHSRLITSSEEIAFYGGHEIERSALYGKYLALVKHMNKVYQLRILYTSLESFFMKYSWTAAGQIMVALPVFLTRKGPTVIDTMSTRAQDIVTSRKLLISAADAVERIMSSYKEVTELAGYTNRVVTMINVFEDVNRGVYVKEMIKGSNNSMKSATGQVIADDNIKFENIPIVSPNGDVLVKSLSLEVKPNMHVLITGPNGCGKSSLFRILGGLWPLFGGVAHKPANKKDIFYIPQRPYFSMGTLRDQVIYPDSIETMHQNKITDADLEALLDWVNLRYIVERDGWDARNDWHDVLSGGEKQRMAMSRLFYHRPRYAILDECTSAVSVDVEGKMYSHAKDLSITLMTVTHRPSLWKYHDYILQFDGEGGWRFQKLDSGTLLTLKEEKSKLEGELSGVPSAQKRLKELCQLLGEDSALLPNHLNGTNNHHVSAVEVLQEIE